MAKRTPAKPRVNSLTMESGNRLGVGQDNLVNEALLPPYAHGLAETGEWVVKVSHKSPNAKDKRNWSLPSKEAAVTGTQYKQKKYELLKHFLGDFVPDSIFLVSDVETNGVRRPAEVTLQRRVPNHTIDSLSEEQKTDPRLQQNLMSLFGKLRYMYSVIGEANGRASQGASIDGKLDLGGVSDFARSRSIDQDFTEQDVVRAAHKISSPNLLVDPETMSLYCIDYDQGDWNSGMESTQNLAFEIDANRHATGLGLGAAALSGVASA